MTKKEMFAAIATVVENSNHAQRLDLMNFVQHEIELLDRRSASKTMTAKQKENENFKTEIFTFLEDAARPMTVSEIMEGCTALDGLKSQRVTAIISQMVKAQTLVRTEVKGKAYFSVGE